VRVVVIRRAKVVVGVGGRYPGADGCLDKCNVYELRGPKENPALEFREGGLNLPSGRKREVSVT
jgi:hypothetical protein